MNYNIKNYTLESDHRNKILHFLYDRIPSYALFDSNTIKNESILNRYKWWKEIQSEKKYKQNIIKKIKLFFFRKLKIYFFNHKKY